MWLLATLLDGVDTQNFHCHRVVFIMIGQDGQGCLKDTYWYKENEEIIVPMYNI